MSFGGAMLALSAVQGITQIGQGYAQKAEAGYNAQLYEGKAELIEEQKNIEFGQYQRLKARTTSTSMANIAKAGIMPTGSAMAVMVDTLTQINIDQAIGQFNLNQERLYTKAEAETYRRRGRMAVYTGYSSAFATALGGLSDYSRYSTKTKKEE